MHSNTMRWTSRTQAAQQETLAFFADAMRVQVNESWKETKSEQQQTMAVTVVAGRSSMTTHSNDIKLIKLLYAAAFVLLAIHTAVATV